MPLACDAHHVVHWADGGATSLDNLVLLCRHHHTLTHRTPWKSAHRRRDRPAGVDSTAETDPLPCRGPDHLRPGPLPRPARRTAAARRLSDGSAPVSLVRSGWSCRRAWAWAWLRGALAEPAPASPRRGPGASSSASRTQTPRSSASGIQSRSAVIP
ncbi:HNH endonuclease signature motif containing protein [Nocardioides convexus]|uniref:HNH endonuclease signature motif containing protein n=1 Tax=Nocardioides convexus TaxID=2712224 RepID=UPI0031010725